MYVDDHAGLLFIDEFLLMLFKSHCDKGALSGGGATEGLTLIRMHPCACGAKLLPMTVLAYPVGCVCFVTYGDKALY